MSRRLLIALGAVIVVVVLGVVAWFVFIDEDEPPPVSIDDAVESVEGGSSSDEPSTLDDLTGTWVVDTESGDFDYESATGSFAGFRVDEELTIGSTTAVGRTGDVSGTAEFDGTTLTAATFDVDLSTLTTNDQRRDNRVQSALETSEFPDATFVLSEPIDLGDGALDEGAATVTATGELTIHGVTRDATFDIDARVVDDTIVVVGSSPVVFTDFDVEVPSAPIVVSVDDEGLMELQLLLIRDS